MTEIDPRDAFGLLMSTDRADLATLIAKLRHGADRAPYWHSEQTAEVMTVVADALAALLPSPAPECAHGHWRDYVTVGEFIDEVEDVPEEVHQAMRRIAAATTGKDADDWAPWLKAGETPLERLKRERSDNDMLIGKLAEALRRAEARVTPAAQPNPPAHFEPWCPCYGVLWHMLACSCACHKTAPVESPP